MATYEHRMHYTHPTHKPESSLQTEKWFPSISSKVLSLFKTFGNQLFNFFSRGSELRVWQTQDQTGGIWWNVYDPTTQQTARLLSEMEVRVWIEQRYYGKADYR